VTVPATNHAVGLAGEKRMTSEPKREMSKRLGPDGHQFDGAAGEAHRHRPDGIGAKPVQGGVNRREDDIPLDL